ncbi:aryl-alcohol oxidase [Crucibulum laeve]|uniref:Aryl-alcohol oxidase n=1 Tax=Crucibulum laeve TaxID=68775 RepID=A0A5C3LQK5_9AGAR|nr:aryl-alcohol oxidase [Crucibulum laeve]
MKLLLYSWRWRKAAGPKAAHWEIFSSVNPGVALPAQGSFVSVLSVFISPTSRGSVQITTSDPFNAPTINPNFLSTTFDTFALREAVKAVKRFMPASAWANRVIAPWGALGTAATDAQVEAYARASAEAIFHPVGTPSMSPFGAACGVVDPDLKVKGVSNLRIVDASDLPFAPDAHTQGPVYLVAERAATLIVS